MQGPPSGGRLRGQGRFFLSPQNEGRFFTRLFLQGVWGLLVVSRIRYWVCGYFPLRHTLIASLFPKTPNYRSPSRYQLIFMSRNGNASLVTNLTLSSFEGRGGFASVVHISAVKCRCWLPAIMFTLFWKSYNQYFISFSLFFPLNTTRPSSW